MTPKAIKTKALKEFGLDEAVILTFDARLAGLSAEEFVRQVLVERLGVKAVVVGRDFHFGKGRSGSPAFLKDAGKRYGFRVDILEKIEATEGDLSEAISSTVIRRALEAGDVAAAARLLGRNYAISGTVIHGQKLGRTLGVPTANIALDVFQIGSPTASMRSRRLSSSVRFGGVLLSFGTRPTIDDGAPLLEVFLFDFAEDLYGKEIEVAFVERIRGERVVRQSPGARR